MVKVANSSFVVAAPHYNVDATGTKIDSTNPFSVADSYRVFTALTVGAGDITAGRAVQIACTVAGNVSLKMANGSTNIIPVDVGLSVLPYSVVGVNTSGTTATATYGSLS